ncbi:MAG: AMP-binding protein, partial [Pseudomonadota bacterium]
MSDATQHLYPSAYAAKDPDRVAFTMCNTSEVVTYGALEARSNQGAQLFRSLGLAPGDHVAIAANNDRQYLEFCFAADRSGLYYTTINTRLTAADIGHIVGDCGARLILVGADVLDQLPGLDGQLAGVPYRYIIGGRADGFSVWDETIADYTVIPIDDEHQGLDMLYSSGTTGRPKG